VTQNPVGGGEPRAGGGEPRVGDGESGVGDGEPWAGGGELRAGDGETWLGDGDGVGGANDGPRLGVGRPGDGMDVGWVSGSWRIGCWPDDALHSAPAVMAPTNASAAAATVFRAIRRRRWRSP
jgi:hypothetical protein